MLLVDVKWGPRLGNFRFVSRVEVKVACCLLNYEFQPPFHSLSHRFRSDSVPSLTIPRCGISCMQMQPSFVRLDHFPLNLLPLSSARSCGRRDWRSYGPCSLSELCRTSLSHTMASLQEISMMSTLSVGGGSPCVNRSGGSYCMISIPNPRHVCHRFYGTGRADTSLGLASSDI